MTTLSFGTCSSRYISFRDNRSGLRIDDEPRFRTALFRISLDFELADFSPPALSFYDMQGIDECPTFFLGPLSSDCYRCLSFNHGDLEWVPWK